MDTIILEVFFLDFRIYNFKSILSYINSHMSNKIRYYHNRKVRLDGMSLYSKFLVNRMIGAYVCFCCWCWGGGVICTLSRLIVLKGKEASPGRAFMCTLLNMITRVLPTSLPPKDLGGKKESYWSIKWLLDMVIKGPNAYTQTQMNVQREWRLCEAATWAFNTLMHI